MEKAERRPSVRGIGLGLIELERLRARVGRLFAALEEAAEEAAPGAPGVWCPPVDLYESGEAVEVHIELPGVSAEQIKLTLTTAHLRISGTKVRSVPQGRLAHLCSERNYGEFNRVVPLRWPVRAPGATAKLRNGLLTVRLPKLEDRRGAEFVVPVEEAGDG